MPVRSAPYPVNLLLDGRKVLVVGGGAVAVEKATGLAAAGAEVHVIAPVVDEGLRGVASAVAERAYEPGDVVGYRLAVACTDDPAVNQAVFDDGEAAGVWVNAADDPERCSYTLPARFDRGDLLVTVSTGGRSPAVATWVRDRLATELGEEYATLLDLVADARAERRAAGLPTAGADWRSALDSGMLDHIRAGRLDQARALLRVSLQIDDPTAPEPRS